MDKFNEFRDKKSRQLYQCEQEIVRLYDHVEKVEAILSGFEKGEYPVVQRQGNTGRPTTGVILSIDETLNSRPTGTLPKLINSASESYLPEDEFSTTSRIKNLIGVTKAGSINLPKGLRPKNPLMAQDASKENRSLAKRIVMKYRHKEAEKVKAQEDALKSSLKQAQSSKSMGALDPEIQEQIQNMLVSPSGMIGRKSNVNSTFSNRKVSESFDSANNRPEGAKQAENSRPSTTGAKSRTYVSFGVSNFNLHPKTAPQISMTSDMINDCYDDKTSADENLVDEVNFLRQEVEYLRNKEKTEKVLLLFQYYNLH